MVYSFKYESTGVLVILGVKLLKRMNQSKTFMNQITLLMAL